MLTQQQSQTSGNRAVQHLTLLTPARMVRWASCSRSSWVLLGRVVKQQQLDPCVFPQGVA